MLHWNIALALDVEIYVTSFNELYRFFTIDSYNAPSKNIISKNGTSSDSVLIYFRLFNS